jgi:hypothetical protein
LSRVLDAIHWDGTTPMVSLFLVTSAEEAPDLTTAWGVDAPRQARAYRLEDDRPSATLPIVHEYDFEFETLPAGLEHDLKSCLHAACQRAGSVAWLAFEGSFHFDHILTTDVADQIYGICAFGDSALVVLDDAPTGRTALKERMHTYRIRLGLS